jgi:ADP-heptose:LPS heptosyltransferase
MRRFCAFDIVRFKEDKRPADTYFSSLEEAVSLMLGARCVISSDSAISHVAQFFAAKHVLICSRSRPGNVCFPGAANTRVLDFGSTLRCRPCAYVEYTKPVCAAGFVRCKALVDPNREKENRLKEALLWAGLSSSI